MRRALPQLATAAALLALLVVCLLGQDNLGSNEAGKLALALQQIRPTWNPGDWYLNTPQHYQWLFQQIAGQLLDQLGITWGSLAVRLAGYGLWAWAVAALSLQLGLHPALSLGAVAVFLLDQSVIAREWMLGSGEPKTLAYGALILAFVGWRRRRAWRAGCWSGLACSFHVLVGGYGGLALAGLAWIRRRRQALRPLRGIALGFVMGLTPLLVALLQALHGNPTRGPGGGNGPLPEGLSATWIYTYLRNPHHLVPASWSAGEWLAGALWLGLFAAACWLAQRDGSAQAGDRQDLALWTALTLVPFAVGLAISPWDREGSWLRFYPFRVADSLVPLSTCLLLAGELQRRSRRLGSVLALLLAVAIAIQQAAGWMPGWGERLASGFQPDAEKRALYGWIRQHSPPGTTVLAPPSGFEDLPLLTGRAGVGQFKQVPNRSTDVQTWFQRMGHLSGDTDFWRRSRGLQTRRRLVRGYAALGPAELERLSRRYGAEILIAGSEQAAPAGWMRQLNTSDWSLWSTRDLAQPSPPAAADAGSRAGQREANPRPINN